MRSHLAGSLWRRGLAHAVDLTTVISLVWTLSVLQVFWFMDDLVALMAPGPWGRAFVPTLFCACGLFVFDTLFVRLNRGQTPGRDLCAVRVIVRDAAAAEDHRDLSLTRAAMHALPLVAVVMAPVGPLTAVAIAVYLLPASVLNRATLSDVLAGTRTVVYDRDAVDPDSDPRPRFAPRVRLYSLPKRLTEFET